MQPSGDQIETDEQYKNRLIRVADALGKIFAEHPEISLGLLQELPTEVGDATDKFFYLFKSQLAQNDLHLTVDLGQGLVTRYAHYKNIRTLQTTDIDQEIMFRFPNFLPKEKEFAGNKTINGMSSFYDLSSRVLYVSTHASFKLDAQELALIFKEKFQGLVRKFSTKHDPLWVKFVGDFNHSAKEINKEFEDIGFSLIQTTEGEKSYSASGNETPDGNNPFNIDLLVQVSFQKPKAKTEEFEHKGQAPEAQAQAPVKRKSIIKILFGK